MLNQYGNKFSTRFSMRFSVFFDLLQVYELLILRRRLTPAFRMGSKAPLSINPEQPLGFRLGESKG